jgi:hypothetical protein
MSNHLAPATVTAVLQRRLANLTMDLGIGGFAASVSVGRPNTNGAGAPQAAINIFLYQAVPNASWRNVDLPTRRDDGTVAQRPLAAVDLHYLLTFLGSGENHKYEPERLLGMVIADLHSRPLLTAGMIENAIGEVLTAAGTEGGYLSESDLAKQIESVKLTPLSLNLEELSKLWSIFFQTPYALSVAYKASVLLIEADETPQQALPVKDRDIRAIGWRQPVIESITSDTGAGAPILHGSTLVIRGRKLLGETGATVWIGNEENLVSRPAAKDDEIRLSVPISLRAGIHTVRITQDVLLGKPRAAHACYESNAVPFVLAPEIRTAPPPTYAAGKLIVKFDPAVIRAQRVALLLNEIDGDPDEKPHAYVVDAPQDNGIVSPETDTHSIEFDLSGVEVGRYLIRLRVDGAMSPLTHDGGKYSDPAVALA